VNSEPDRRDVRATRLRLARHPLGRKEAELAIPQTFTEAQAELTLSLARVCKTDSRASAERLLQEWTPERFSEPRPLASGNSWPLSPRNSRPR
jgi:hypothetical protein